MTATVTRTKSVKTKAATASSTALSFTDSNDTDEILVENDRNHKENQLDLSITSPRARNLPALALAGSTVSNSPPTLPSQSAISLSGHNQLTSDDSPTNPNPLITSRISSATSVSSRRKDSGTTTTGINNLAVNERKRVPSMEHKQLSNGELTSVLRSSAEKPPLPPHQQPVQLPPQVKNSPPPVHPRSLSNSSTTTALAAALATTTTHNAVTAAATTMAASSSTPQQVVTRLASDGMSREEKEAYLKEFDMLSTIGAGTFGRVLLVRHQETRRHYALKIMSIAEIVKLKQVDHVRNEKSVLAEMRPCAFIVDLFWTHRTTQHL
jgi:hypothetical protein